MKVRLTEKAVEFIKREGKGEATIISKESINVSGCCGGEAVRPYWITLGSPNEVDKYFTIKEKGVILYIPLKERDKISEINISINKFLLFENLKIEIKERTDLV